MKHLHAPPPDQAIVDDYFQLLHKKSFGQAAWLYGMLATYGVHPKELKGFTWNTDNTISIHSKKKKIRPMHPQWVILFQLKEKQPSKLENCFKSIQEKLEAGIKNKVITLNLTDLILSYRIRKDFYQMKKVDQQTQSPAYAVLSVR